MSDVQAHLRKFDAAFQDHGAFCRECLSIRDKRGHTVVLEQGPAQIKLSKKIRELRARKRPVRIVYLKARQVWASVGFATEVMHEVPFKAGQRALVVAHDEDSAVNIFGYYKQFHEGFRAFRGVIGLPATKRFSEEGLIEYANGSKVEVATAGNPRAGRSKSLRFLHLSEFAFWPNPDVLMAGLMQAVPDDPDTMVVVESTANGMGGEFFEMCQRAMDPAQESEWVFLFFAWWEHPEYVRELESDAAEFEASLDLEERDLVEKYSLTLGQLAWRRWAIANKCQSSVEIFHQEYPSSPEEAFISSGRPRFSMPHLARMPVHEGARCNLELLDEGGRKSVVMLPDPKGILTVFKRPQPRHRYAIGIDVCEGIDVSAVAGRSRAGSENPDFSVSSVFDIATGEQVAVMRWRIQPAPWARETYSLGRWYNWAYIVPEANGPGLALLDELLRAGYPVGKIYHRDPDPDDQFSGDTESVMTKLGWKTTVVTRVHLVSKLDRAIRELSIHLADKVTVGECRTFVIKASGRSEHATGCHDDTVIAAALALVGIEAAPLVKDLADRRDALERLGGGAPSGRYGRRRSVDRGALIRL